MVAFLCPPAFFRGGSRISYIGSNVSPSASVTLPAHQTGDLIIIYAVNKGTGAPSLPAGYTSIEAFTTSANLDWRAGYKVATSNAETSGTWTSADVVIAHVYRGVAASPIGNRANNNATSSTISYFDMSMAVTNGSSWLVMFSAVNIADSTALETPPTGTTLRVNTSITGTFEMSSFDTNGGVPSWTEKTVALGSSQEWVSTVIEIKSA